MYSVLNTLSECKYFYISKNITSFVFLLVFKTAESLKCILNWFTPYKAVQPLQGIKIHEKEEE